MKRNQAKLALPLGRTPNSGFVLKLVAVSAAIQTLASKPRLTEPFDWEFFGLTPRDMRGVCQAKNQVTRKW
jgi:hypothetical protein